MSEQAQQAIGEASELETLRKVNAELVAKHARDKAKIAELETGTATLQAKLSEAVDSLKQATVSGPLNAMAESMSTAPELFLEQFSKHYRVEMVKGALTLLLSSDGKAVLDKNGKPVPFERRALTDLLTVGDDSSAKAFRAITIANRASGAANVGQRSNQAPAKKAPSFYFGIR
jgi:hypothetical protein